MDSFEELGLADELVEALSSEGVEHPNALQQAAMPVLRRGNNALLAAGPGGGTLVAWGAAVLERLDAEATTPRALVLTSTVEGAQGLAESLQRIAGATGHTVAALGSPWVLPGRAQILFGTPGDVLEAVRAGEVDLAGVEVLVVDQADRIERLGGLGPIEQVLDFLPKDGQRVVTSLPVTPAVADLVERHVRRAVTLPAQPADRGTPEAAPPVRGTLRYRVVGEPKEEGVLALVSEVLAGDVRHVLLFCRSEDRAADLGDYLALHGYGAGAPGDEAAPVWLGVRELEARSAAQGAEGVTVMSCDVPADPDSLDRRHGLISGGYALVLPREMAHLRDVARRTGYRLEAQPHASRHQDETARFRDMIAKAVEDEDNAPYMLLLEPLFERYDPAEVAAAVASLLRKKVPPAPAAPATTARAAGRTAPPAWVRLFLSVGERDGLAPKDLLGAITGEAGVGGGKVGKIDIRESHSVVEVQDEVAQKVISALNGTTIRGRAVRADFDRGRGKPSGSRSGPPRGRAPRRG